MSEAGARGAAYDAAVRANDGPAAQRARRKRMAAIEYAERELDAARDGLARVEGKAVKFEEAARLVREAELPEAADAVTSAEARLAQAREAAEVD